MISDFKNSATHKFLPCVTNDDFNKLKLTKIFRFIHSN
jgi:hypothetical protein